MYISVTGRSLEDGIKEHKYAVRSAQHEKWAHAWTNDHPVDWKAAKVVMLEQHPWRRKVLEAIHIQKAVETSNLDIGLHINPIWTPVLT